MNDTRIFAGGLFAVGLAVVTAFFMFTQSTTPASAQAEDGPGRNLVIELGGSVTGRIVIDLDEANAPGHAERLISLAERGAYDGIAFHRVIEGFMAQTGDVQYGKVEGFDPRRAGTGGSDDPDLTAEFSSVPFDRGVVGMARTNDPNSANSQFFIMFAPAPHLNGAYTVIGKVVEGMEAVDLIKRGPRNQNGAVTEAPDFMAKVSVEP